MNIRKSHDPGPVPAAEPGKTQPGLPIQGGPPEDEEIFSDQSPGYDAGGILVGKEKQRARSKETEKRSPAKQGGHRPAR